MDRKYFAFLRGINISGKNKIAMSDLKAEFVGLGFTDVETYLNSGNVRFSADDIDLDILRKHIEEMIQDRFGMDVPVHVLRAEELQDILANAPTWWGTEDKEQYDNLIFILSNDSPENIADMVGPTTEGVEKIQIFENIIFWAFDKKAYQKCNWWKKTATVGIAEKLTIRTANTLRKLTFMLVLLAVFCTGCGSVPKTSKTYMIGFDYSAYDYQGNGYPVVSKIRYDKTVEALYVWNDEDGNECSREVITRMSDSSFEYLCNYIDLKKLYHLDPEELNPDEKPNYDYCYLTIFAEDDSVLKEVGGYAPQNNDFNTMRHVINICMPDDYKYVYDKFQRDGCLTDFNVINHTDDLDFATEIPDFLTERLEQEYTGNFYDYNALYPVRVASSNDEFIEDMKRIFDGYEFREPNCYTYNAKGELVDIYLSGNGARYWIFRTDSVSFEVKADGVYWRDYAEEGMYADLPIIYDSTGKYALYCQNPVDDDIKRYIGWEQ